MNLLDSVELNMPACLYLLFRKDSKASVFIAFKVLSAYLSDQRSLFPPAELPKVISERGEMTCLVKVFGEFRDRRELSVICGFMVTTISFVLQFQIQVPILQKNQNLRFVFLFFNNLVQIKLSLLFAIYFYFLNGLFNLMFLGYNRTGGYNMSIIAMKWLKAAGFYAPILYHHVMSQEVYLCVPCCKICALALNI